MMMHTGDYQGEIVINEVPVFNKEGVRSEIGRGSVVPQHPQLLAAVIIAVIGQIIVPNNPADVAMSRDLGKTTSFAMCQDFGFTVG